MTGENASISRRALIRSAAGAGIAAATAGVVGIATAAPIPAATIAPTSLDPAAGPTAAPTRLDPVAGPAVAHLVDPRTVEIFTEGRRARVTDEALAAGIAHAAGRGDIDGPVVVHVTDPAAGVVEVFSTDRRALVTDHTLAARIGRAAHH